MPLSSKVDICNFALAHLGSDKDIANFDSEKSKEAAACRLYYDNALDAVLRDFPWPFARKEQPLGLVANNPTPEWARSYRYPADAIFVRRIRSGVRNDTRQSLVSYEISQDSQGLLILTDEDDAVMEYTFRETQTNRYPSDFVTALSYKLAQQIAARITNGDPFKIKREVLQLYLAELSKAQSTGEAEQQPDEPPNSEFERARGGC